MGLKETIAKVRSAVEDQISRFPVRSVGVEIGQAKEWEGWVTDDGYYLLYYGFKPCTALIPVLADWDCILFDYEEGFMYKFAYDEKENTIDVEWDFPLEVLVILGVVATT